MENSPTLDTLEKAAAAVGARVREVRSHPTRRIPRVFIYVEAPAGRVWADRYEHTLEASWVAGAPGADLKNRRRILGDLIRAVAAGLEDCGDDECEACHPEDSCEYCWKPATHERTLPEDAAEGPDPEAARYLYCVDHAPADAAPLPPGDDPIESGD